jgi:alpha-tubulin suppressor-like RCC1 family protein
LGNSTHQEEFVKIDLDCELVSIGCGGFYSYLLGREGELFVSGWNKTGQLGLGDVVSRQRFERVQLPIEFGRVVSFQCALDHVLLLTEDGELRGAGSNVYGELGFVSEFRHVTPFTKLGIGLNSTILTL